MNLSECKTLSDYLLAWIPKKGEMANIVPCDAYEIPENSRLHSIELVIVYQE
jgi:hypothetical protein